MNVKKDTKVVFVSEHGLESATYKGKTGKCPVQGELSSLLVTDKNGKERMLSTVPYSVERKSGTWHFGNEPKAATPEHPAPSKPAINLLSIEELQAELEKRKAVLNTNPVPAPEEPKELIVPEPVIESVEPKYALVIRGGKKTKVLMKNVKEGEDILGYK